MSEYNGQLLAEAILKKLKNSGAEKAYSRLTKTTKYEMNIDSGKLSLYRTTENITSSMAALVGVKRGFLSTNDISDEALNKTAEQVVQLANSSEPDEANDISPKQPQETMKFGDDAPNSEKMFESLQEFLAYVKTTFPTLTLNQCILSFDKKETIYANTNGVMFTENYGLYNFQVMFFAKDKNGVSSFNYTGACHSDLKKPLISWGGANEVMKENCLQTQAQKLGGSFIGDIIITPTAAASLIPNALYSFLGDTSFISGTSPWKDSLNTKVASELFTVKTLPEYGETEMPCLITGDGFKAKNTTIIEKGVLQSLLLTLYGSKKTGKPRCISGGEGFVISNGNQTKDNIIGSVKKGILLARFSGGRPSSNGDFSGVAKNSFLIEDGKITKPLSETMVAGNFLNLFSNIQAVSSDVVDFGDTTAPWIHSNGITISG